MEKRLNSEDFCKKLSEKALSIVVFGASGHLAKTKTFPALFDLFTEHVFPKTTSFVGCSRSKLDNNEFRQRISAGLNGADYVAQFCESSVYFCLKGYDDEESFLQFGDFLNTLENEKGFRQSNRLFYFALPPNVYQVVAQWTSKHLFSNGWNRVIIEKPFGRDLETCVELIRSIRDFLDESCVYRIDHYLAKEMSQNIMTLRFGNTIWDYIWHRKAINCVRLSFKESAGVEGRGGYYDQFGAIRDIFQNHLMQIFTLLAMEAPIALRADDIRDEKVKVLKAISPPSMDQVIVGQYTASSDGQPGYRDDPSVPKGSRQATFFQTVLFINNGRWQGIPWICKCGKALDERRAEIRIQFKNDGLHLFPGAEPNELVIRLQPNEAMYFKINTKVPGFAYFDNATQTELNISYNQRFENLRLPDAYSRLIADALRGDQSLFVREDELRESWRITTPILHALEQNETEPIFYPRGSRGPPQADQMAIQHGFRMSLNYQWPKQAIPPTKL